MVPKGDQSLDSHKKNIYYWPKVWGHPLDLNISKFHSFFGLVRTRMYGTLFFFFFFEKGLPKMFNLPAQLTISQQSRLGKNSYNSKKTLYSNRFILLLLNI